MSGEGQDVLDSMRPSAIPDVSLAQDQINTKSNQRIKSKQMPHTPRVGPIKESVAQRRLDRVVRVVAVEILELHPAEGAEETVDEYLGKSDGRELGCDGRKCW